MLFIYYILIYAADRSRRYFHVLKTPVLFFNAFYYRQADSFRSEKIHYRPNIHYRSNINYRHANARDNPDEKNILKFFAVSPTIRAERFVI